MAFVFPLRAFHERTERGNEAVKNGARGFSVLEVVHEIFSEKSKNVLSRKAP